MELFRKLLETASPSGHEKGVQDIVIEELDAMGVEHVLDKHGNIWTRVGETDQPTLFTAHMDCIHNDHPVILDWDDDTGIVKLHGDCKQRALGADDSVGVRMLLHMIEHSVEALYIFTTEEETGCKGAAFAAKFCPDYIKHAITFDRKDVSSVITSMSWGKCCSDEFAQAIIDGLDMGHEMDDTGSTTDTEKFRDKTLNHTNISAGYYQEHTKSERCDLDYVQDLMDAVLKVKWNELPQVKRPVIPKYSVSKYMKYKAPSFYFMETLADSNGGFEEVIDNLMAVVDKRVTHSMYFTKAEMKEMLEGLLLVHFCSGQWDIETTEEKESV